MYTHTQGYYAATKRNEDALHVLLWKKLQDVLSGKIEIKTKQGP